MKTKRTKVLGKIIVLSLITATMTYGSDTETLDSLKNKDNTTLESSYQNMTTAQLQEEVEKRSINDNMSFALGKELMKRWTKS